MSLYFTICQPFLMALLSFIIYSVISSHRLQLKESLLFLGVIFITNYLTSIFHIPKIAALLNYLIVLVFEYLSHKKNVLSFVTSLIYIAVLILSDMITGFFVLLYLKSSFYLIHTIPTYNLTIYLVGIPTTYGIAKGIKALISYRKINLEKIKQEKMLFAYIFITALVVYLNVTVLATFANYMSVKIVSLLIIIFALYCLLGIAFIYIINQHSKKNIELEMKVQENSKLTEYAALLEKQHDDLRAFKHDYMNMLATLGGYIQLRDIDKLDRYFKEKILNGGEIFKQDENLKLIKKIRSIPIRGMFYAKLVKIQNTDIAFHLNVNDSIPLFDANEIDVCKIIGILIDNAIEATSSSQEKKLLITLEHSLETIRLSVSNSFSEEIKNINQLYNKGFSTKGEGRGLGLHTVKALLENQYKNAKLMTTIENNLFIQELLFPVKND